MWIGRRRIGICLFTVLLSEWDLSAVGGAVHCAGSRKLVHMGLHSATDSCKLVHMGRDISI